MHSLADMHAWMDIHVHVHIHNINGGLTPLRIFHKKKLSTIIVTVDSTQYSQSSV